MILLFPFHPGDIQQAEAWMRWTHELGAGRNHSVILMPAKAVKDYAAIMETAIRAFQKVDVLQDAEGIEGHPEGPNSMMRQAVWHMHTSNLGPWMFCEPDNVLLTTDSLDIWEREYRAYGKPFMGEHRPAHDVTPDYLSGNMMLPKDALMLAPMLSRRGLSKDGVELAFDIVAASQTLPQAHLTKLLQQVPKPRDGEGHHFTDQDSLKIIRDGAVMFHPCKDGSLIERLRERNSGTALSASAPAKSGDKVETHPLTSTAPAREQELLERIAKLESLLTEGGRVGPAIMSASTSSLKATPRKQRMKARKKVKRTPEQQAEINARMAKARAARKVAE